MDIERVTTEISPNQDIFTPDLLLTHVGVTSPFAVKVTVYPYTGKPIFFQDINFWFSSCNLIGTVLAKAIGKNSKYSYHAYVSFPDNECLDAALCLNENIISTGEYLTVQNMESHIVEKTHYKKDIVNKLDQEWSSIDTNNSNTTNNYSHILILENEGLIARSKYCYPNTTDTSIPERYKPKKRNIDPEFPLALKSFDGSLLSKNVGPEPKQITHPKIDVRIFVDDDYPYDLPKYATVGSAGFDILAYIKEPIKIKPGQIVKIHTGLKMAISQGYELQIRSRSGLAFSGVVVTNSPGTVDSDYRGLIGVLLTNIGHAPFIVGPGMKIAQGIISPVYHANFVRVKTEEELGETQRGEGGFGSTGL